MIEKYFPSAAKGSFRTPYERYEDLIRLHTLTVQRLGFQEISNRCLIEGNISFSNIKPIAKEIVLILIYIRE